MVPVVRVSDFSSVKQITLVVAARGCYRSHSAVELGRINEHHPQSPALTAGKSFLGSQPTLRSLLLEDPRPRDAQMPHSDLADSCLENSCKWRLTIETCAARDPSPGRGAVLSLPRGSCCSLPQLDPYGAEFPSCSGSTPLAGAAAAALGGTKCWCRRAGGMAGGGQPAVGSSFLALVFVGGLAPALCGQRTPCLQHRAAGQTPQPVQQQLEPPGHSRAPPDSQKFTPVNQEEQEAELC